MAAVQCPWTFPCAIVSPPVQSSSRFSTGALERTGTSVSLMIDARRKTSDGTVVRIGPKALRDAFVAWG